VYIVYLTQRGPSSLRGTKKSSIAGEEGVQFLFLTNPTAILSDEKRLGEPRAVQKMALDSRTLPAGHIPRSPCNEGSGN
jgi:hypothetical protein